VDQFSKFFHQLIREKILYVHTIQRLSSHLQYVAALLCEIQISKKCYGIFTLNVTINMFN